MCADAGRATALMCTNVVAYVLLMERRRGCSLQQLQQHVEARADALLRAGRDLAHVPSAAAAPALTRKAVRVHTQYTTTTRTHASTTRTHLQPVGTYHLYAPTTHSHSQPVSNNNLYAPTTRTHP